MINWWMVGCCFWFGYSITMTWLYWRKPSFNFDRCDPKDLWMDEQITGTSIYRVTEK